MASRNYNSKSYDWSNLKKGYYDEKGNLRKELIVEEAEKIGERFVRDRLSKSQIRNFFNEVKALEEKIKVNSFDKNFPFILMLMAKASYAYKQGKSNSKIPKSFYEFINVNINLIEKKGDQDTFQGFVTFFETVVAYFYGHGGGNIR